MARTYTLSFKITYAANGGTGAPGTTEKTISNTSGLGDITLTISSTRPTRSGYTFQCWRGVWHQASSSAGTTTNFQPGNSVTHTFDNATTYTWGSGNEINHAYASYTLALTAMWIANNTINIVNSAGTGLDKYLIYIVNSAGTGLDKYRAYIVNSDASALVAYG